MLPRVIFFEKNCIFFYLLLINNHKAQKKAFRIGKPFLLSGVIITYRHFHRFVSDYR